MKSSTLVAFQLMVRTFSTMISSLSLFIALDVDNAGDCGCVGAPEQLQWEQESVMFDFIAALFYCVPMSNVQK